MNRVVFILNDISHPRCHKRISEFIGNGYKVAVYGFSRKGFVTPYITPDYTPIILANIGEGNYLARLRVLYNSIKQALSNTEKSDIIYLFGLDIAMMSFIQCGKQKYIYEESDLAHTYINNIVVKWLLERIDLAIIKKSFMSVFTSAGFVKYHFDRTQPNNIYLLPNRLNPTIENIPSVTHKKIDINHIQFGFVGALRFKSVFRFAEFIGKYYPQHTFHFFGACNKKEIYLFDELKNYQNIIFHGKFSNPNDLPSIYSQIDLVISTYDTEFENVRYAEPNKLYEAIYFNTPIVVSTGTYLEEKVLYLGIGFAVNTKYKDSLNHFIDNLTERAITRVVDKIKMIPKTSVINENSDFFIALKNKLKDL